VLDNFNQEIGFLRFHRMQRQDGGCF
jgi:hypothetical protein